VPHSSNSIDRFTHSLAACYTALESPRLARRILVALLVIHSSLLAYSAYVHSPTLNEPGHLVAGLSYWKFGRFDVYSVNPPLVRLVAALPVMAAGYEEDWSGYSEGPGARPEFAMGEDDAAGVLPALAVDVDCVQIPRSAIHVRPRLDSGGWNAGSSDGHRPLCAESRLRF
jgi:hypothetical protein